MAAPFVSNYKALEIPTEQNLAKMGPHTPPLANMHPFGHFGRRK